MTSPLSFPSPFTVRIILKISCFLIFVSDSPPICPATCVFFRKKIAEDNNTAAAPIPKINNDRER